MKHREKVIFENAMKAVIALMTAIVFFGESVSAFAQGQVNFSNAGPGVNAPISDASGNRIIGPSPYVADLFWSTDTNAPMDNLTPASQNTPFSSVTNYGGGYFFGGSITLPWTTILAQVRVWDTRFGTTYYGARDKGGEFGFSNLIIVVPDPAPGQPSPLTGLESFQLQRLPHVASVVTTTNTIVFSWPTEQTTYAVQQNPDISQSNWVTLPNQPVTVGQQQQVILPVPSIGRMFYRLVSQ